MRKRGYETCRFPFSGLRGDLEGNSERHNMLVKNKYNGHSLWTDFLNLNLTSWLNMGMYKAKVGASDKFDGDGENVPLGHCIHAQFIQCLRNDNYNAFSNTSSAAYLGKGVPLEQPHNDLHLAVGGFCAPDGKIKLEDQVFGIYDGANGDMAFNDVAAFDSVFFFHHANIDRVFSIWQKLRGFDKHLEINDKDDKDPGLYDGGSKDWKHLKKLTMDSHLVPFQNQFGLGMTARDCVDIEQQMGYTYSKGSLENFELTHGTGPVLFLRVSNIRKKLYMGSFVVRLSYINPDATSGYTTTGVHSVFSRVNALIVINIRTWWPCLTCHMYRKPSGKRRVWKTTGSTSITWPRRTEPKSGEW